MAAWLPVDRTDRLPDSLFDQVPHEGPMCDLLWSDPEKGQSSWGENDRGVSYTFGEAVIKQFLKKNDIDLICRAH